jgi:HAD superfamily hydrolase (TIGR01509 family)
VRQKIKVAIFDFDETLFFTSEISVASYIDATRIICNGLELHDESIRLLKSGYDYHSAFVHMQDLDHSSIERIHDLKLEIYNTKISEIKPRIAIVRLMNSLSGVCKLAILSNSTRDTVVEILRLHNLYSHFEIVVTREDVTKPKPNPMGINLILKQTNARPDEAILIDDSLIGVEAGHNAGIEVLLVA